MKVILKSIIRETRPDGLFEYFKNHGIHTENPYRGIYYVMDSVLFPAQIIVSRELDRKNHVWLRALSDKMGKQDMKELLKKIESMKQKLDRELAESVLEVSIRANQHVIEELRGDGSMCQALLEIMEPEINIIKESVKKETKRNEILCAVKSFRELGVSDNQIKELLVKNHQITFGEAEKYL